MLTLRKTLKCIQLKQSSMVMVIQTANIKNWKLPKEYDVEFPAVRKLRPFDKHPATYLKDELTRTNTKHLIDMRGPEPVHNFLMHKQYGIQALGAGHMRWGHFESIRNFVNKNIDLERMFAIWRLDPPWKPVTKKGQGVRMGSGKGAIDHYVTPIKVNRIIIEIGGHGEFDEMVPLLRRVAQKLPFDARAVSHEMIETEKDLEKEREEKNMNPFNFKEGLEKNFLGSQKWASPYDYLWHNKYR